MRDARAELDRRFGVAPEVRVGIHTGRVVVTDLSDDGAVAERDSIVGLVPNLAARIQQAAEPGTVVISDVTQQLVDADFFLRSLGERRLKGISRPVEVFAVERPRYAAARFQAERYRKAGLVGRDEPRDRLLVGMGRRAADDGARAGAAFLVVGEAGIGKSRLVGRAPRPGGGQRRHGCSARRACRTTPTSRCGRSRGCSNACSGGRAGARTGSAALVDRPDAPRAGPGRGRSPSSPRSPGSRRRPSTRRPSWTRAPSSTRPSTALVDWVAAVAAADAATCSSSRTCTGPTPPPSHCWAGSPSGGPPGVLTVATTRDDAVVPWRDAAELIRLGRLDGAAADRLIDNLASGQELTGRPARRDPRARRGDPAVHRGADPLQPRRAAAPNRSRCGCRSCSPGG